MLCALNELLCPESLSSLTANILFIQQLQRAASAANLQVGTVLAFRLRIFAVSYFHCKRVIPDLLPLIGEDVSEAFEVALARVNITIRSHAHVYHRRCARFDT